MHTTSKDQRCPQYTHKYMTFAVRTTCPQSRIKYRREVLRNTSSEGERLMLEALVESSRGGRRTVLQYIKMLSVIALPVAAVICLVSYTLHNSRIERADHAICRYCYELSRFKKESGTIGLAAAVLNELVSWQPWSSSKYSPTSRLW